MAELEDLFPEMQAKPQGADINSLFPEMQERETTAAGFGEAALSLGSGIAAQPIAGVAGIISGLYNGDADAGAETVKGVQEALTYDPRTLSGQQILEKVTQAVTPVAQAYGKAETALGNAVLEQTGSPELAAAAHTLPSATLELLGVKGIRNLPKGQSNLSPNIAKAVTQAAPDIKKLKGEASKIYKQIDDSGVRVKPETYDNFVSSLTEKMKKQGIDPTLHPDATSVLKRLQSEAGQPKTISELMTLREIASDAARSIVPRDSRMANIILDSLDDGIDSAVSNIGSKAKDARGLWRRAMKSQQIADMVESASHTASGLENGLRIEARKILRNKKKRMGFTKDELNALRKIEQGTALSNLTKFLGKFGISEGQATSMLGASIGMGGGGALGATFGGAGGAAFGAVAVPALAQIAKKTAQNLTSKHTRMADELVRAGSNGREIAKAYFKNVPKDKRSIQELTNLLASPNVNPESLSNFPLKDKIAQDAAYLARQIKKRAKQAEVAAEITAPAAIESQQEEQ